MTIRQIEETYIDDLKMLDDWMLQYEYLLTLSADMPGIPDAERTEQGKVRGCQSGVWLKLDYADGKVRVRADSDALIIRGILAIIVGLLDGRTPTEIVEYNPRFIGETNIKKQISTDRFDGIHSVVSAIQAYASEHVRGAPAGR